MVKVATQQLSFYFPIEEKAKLQERASRIPIVLKDRDNIEKTLPILLPHQHDNVYKTELRFFSPAETQMDGLNKGIMFTDGTGTGKTFVGLGIIKRFKRMFKDDILVVVPTDAKVKDWIEDGKYFGMNLHQLKNTCDGGYGGSTVVTTYANFRQNNALRVRANKKPFDLVIYDECHKIQSNEAGSSTDADLVHKELTNAPNDAMRKAKEKYFSALLKAKKAENRAAIKEIEEQIEKEAQRLIDETRVVFLSATPFSYHKNLIYADGYLFRMRQGLNGEAAESYKNFFINNFRYQYKFNRLQEPDSDVDVGMMERSFHTKLVKAGCVSSTRLKLDMDYSREFILIDDKTGIMIDEGYQIASDRNVFKHLGVVIDERFTFLYKNQLLECIKAKRSIDRIRHHLDLGRKVVVFHSYNHSLPSHPFDFSMFYDSKWKPPYGVYVRSLREDIEEFHRKYPQYRQLDLSDLTNPIDTITKAFGDRVVMFNGNVSARDRTKVKRQFNDDYSGKDVIVVQMEAGKEGISLHDTTGVKQRVSLNLALPTKPTDAIQSEGRIYRIGQKSDAVIEYPVLHLNFEKVTFAEKINERVKTAENLAFGEQARNLKEAFKEGYKNPVTALPNVEQGKGSRDADMIFDTIDEFTMAIKLYFNRGKRDANTKAKEGLDYFATPEPIGLKMVQWLYSKGNDHLMEPSAGHGAIARYFPENTKNKFIEPSYQLRADLAINAMGDIIPTTFEDFHIVNKFDGVAMCPPVGAEGKTAMEHLDKVLEYHLKDGGRCIVILPDGPAMETRLERWKADPKSKDIFVTGKVLLPYVTFERAGTSVKTQMLIIDKQRNPQVQKKMPEMKVVDLSKHENIKDLFAAIKDIEMPGKLKAEYSDGAYVGVMGDIAQVVPTIHTKNGYKIWVVRLLRVPDVIMFTRMEIEAKKIGGWYSSYDRNGAIPGFIFRNPIYAQHMMEFINKL